MLDDSLRAKQQRVSRALDEVRLKSGEVSLDQLKHDDNFLNAVRVERFRIVAIGSKPLKRSI